MNAIEEAIENADGYLNNVPIPNYRELKAERDELYNALLGVMAWYFCTPEAADGIEPWWWNKNIPLWPGFGLGNEDAYSMSLDLVIEARNALVKAGQT